MPTGQAVPDDLSRVLEAIVRPDLAAPVLPLDDLLTLESARHAAVRRHDRDGRRRRARLQGEQEKLFRCPALCTTGWYDNAAGGEQFNAMRELAATPRGPRRHPADPRRRGRTTTTCPSSAASASAGWARSTAAASRSCTSSSTTATSAARAPTSRPVRYFVMGANEWREVDVLAA